jgi:hypothetical protein
MELLGVAASISEIGGSIASIYYLEEVTTHHPSPQHQQV